MPRRPSRLDTTLLDRIIVRPGWTRTILLRRLGAGALALAAVVLYVQDAAAADRVSVVVAARDLKPGIKLEAGDVRIAEYSPAIVPAGAVVDVGDVLTHTVAGPIRAGEPLTDLRLLSSRLAESAVEGQDARVVPIRLTDAGVTDLLRAGDTVDVLTVGGTDDDRRARLLASNAVVVLVSPEDARRNQRDRVVLVAMSPEDATTVAASSLIDSLTVTLH
ncbi:SAF domain-containing protein [Rhodococcus sp. G-MC3]|uniref:SAF domain-containing protein n=1 Tax=Rhodococcus sp. G-MC3 TaxID=3046209 RepID=UPI0024B9562B|nr:SAF domain-containing protein [Rhodococcus sp. G-MC3]MDJ0393972.1 SAF domain-containing protein [Rhodococcus sp. G-MC3]